MKNSLYQNDHNYNIFIQRGYLLIQQKKYLKAIEHFENILSNYPDDEEIFLGLSLAYYHDNQTIKAISAAYNALKINPENSKTYETLAWIYFINKKDTETAEEYALKGLQLDPNDSYITALLSHIYYFQQNYNKCYYYANKTLELYPENYIAYMILGLYYYDFKEIDLSEKYFTQCLELAPNSADVFCNYGLISLEFSKNKKGYELLKEAVKLNPEIEFYQKAFKDGFIKNHFLYTPINLTNFDKMFPYYLSFTIIMLIFSAIINEINIYNVLPTQIGPIILLLSIFICIFLITLSIYKILIIFIINQIYLNAIKKGKLHKII